MIDFIDLKSQQARIKSQLDACIQRVLAHGQYIHGPKVAELEEKLAVFVVEKYCITCVNGTDALQIAQMAFGIGSGYEVITLGFIYLATAETVALLGAKPVYVDTDSRICNLNPQLLEAAITPRTKAFIRVSLYVQCTDFDAINVIAVKYSILVIEDAAQGFGAEYRGLKSGNLSSIGGTSFFPSKPFGCYGDGGAVFTNDENLAKAMREIRVLGQEKRYVHTRIGLCGRVDTLRCEVVLAKLERFDWEVKQCLKTGARYNELLPSKVPVVARRPRPNQSFFAIHAFRREPRTGAGKTESAGCPDDSALSSASTSVVWVPRKLPSSWGGSYSIRKVRMRDESTYESGIYGDSSRRDSAGVVLGNGRMSLARWAIRWVAL